MSNILTGRTITGMKIADDKEAIKFETTEGDVVVLVDADCCSHTWVEHIEMPSLGFPALVSAVDDLDLPGTTDTENGLLQVYGCKITTDKGEIIIDYRNESNGYYGGNLVWPYDQFYGGVYGQNVSKQTWVEIQ